MGTLVLSASEFSEGRPLSHNDIVSSILWKRTSSTPNDWELYIALLDSLRKMSSIYNDISIETSKDNSAHFASTSTKHLFLLKPSKLSQ